ncbi:MAG: von Willebrand factor type A domain-containing protein, partial [Phycisphaerae bacterium]|nr:von Willebrand factor type A domain-containing protein [Phycisphaerae bacterium]
ADKASGAFLDSVMEDALDELKTLGAGAKRERREKSTKSKWPRIFAYAASIIIVCGVVIGLTIPKLQRARELRKPSFAQAIQANEKGIPDKKNSVRSSPLSVSKEMVLREHEASKKANFENHAASNRVTGRTDYPAASPPPPDRSIELYSDVSRGSGSDRKYIDDIRSVEVKKEHEVAFGVRIPGKTGSMIVACKPPERVPGGYPMAHGGTTPPNGEDVDAMFFKNYGVNPFVDTEDDHLSTFATDVDTGSYTIVRRYLHDGHLPPEKAVRVEEFVNYFKYGYAAPQEDTFAVYAEAAPWRFGTGRKNSYLLRLGLKGRQVSEENRKPAILTFVIDVSGSMNRENRLGLVKRSLRMLVERLREEDQIGIAVYGSRGRKVMDHRGLYEKAEILAAIESLGAGGSTFAEEGIRIGYEMAENAYRRGYINRVILCSDGVANVGQTGADDILEVIRKKAEKGITLSAVGFGMGNYNDVLMERLGDKGDGHYVYIDTIAEARRVFEDNLTGTLQVIGRDVKVQVDFNPEVVRSYRLIGYENRDVPDEKFRDDKYDGGEIGAGHSVTALYELKLWPGKEGTVATTYVRYKHADTSAVTEFKSHIAVEDFDKNFDGSSSEFKLATTVAEFAEILRKSYWAKGATLDRVLEHAHQLSREFEDDADVIELVDLISKAERLMKKVEVEPYEGGEGEEEILRR